MKYKFNIRESILYISNKLCKSNSNSTNNNEGELDDKMMGYECECDNMNSSSRLNDNIKRERSILCDNITVLCGMKIY